MFRTRITLHVATLRRATERAKDMRYDTNEPKHFPPRRYTTRAMRHARIAAKRAFLLTAEVACISAFIGAIMLATPGTADATDAANSDYRNRSVVQDGHVPTPDFVRFAATHRCDTDASCELLAATDNVLTPHGYAIAVTSELGPFRCVYESADTNSDEQYVYFVAACPIVAGAGK